MRALHSSTIGAVTPEDLQVVVVAYVEQVDHLHLHGPVTLTTGKN